VDAGRGPSALGHVELEVTPYSGRVAGNEQVRDLQIRGIA